MNHDQQCTTILVEGVDGEPAATVTITPLDHEASQVITDHLEQAILAEASHLIRD